MCWAIVGRGGGLNILFTYIIKTYFIYKRTKSFPVALATIFLCSSRIFYFFYIILELNTSSSLTYFSILYAYYLSFSGKYFDNL